MQYWRIALAVWLILSGVVWMTGPVFPYAFMLMGVSGIVAGVFLFLSYSEKRA